MLWVSTDPFLINNKSIHMWFKYVLLLVLLLHYILSTIYDATKYFVLLCVLNFPAKKISRGRKRVSFLENINIQ